ARADLEVREDDPALAGLLDPRGRNPVHRARRDKPLEPPAPRPPVGAVSGREVRFVADATNVLPGLLDELAVQVHGEHALGSEPVREKRVVPPGAGADLARPVPVPDIERF